MKRVLAVAFVCGLCGASACLAAAPSASSRFMALTLNLMQRAAVPRQERFAKIADALAAEPADFLLLQEGSGGWWDGTQDSIADLVHLLKQRGLAYHCATRDSFGVAGFLVFKVGVASRYPIEFAEDRCLGDPGKDAFDAFPLPGRKNALAVGARVPGIGAVNVVSVHVYSGGAKRPQVDALLAFVRELEQRHSPAVTIVGGDFNLPDTDAAYAPILAQGFADVGRAAGPTFGLPGNPLGQARRPARIDYLFSKGQVKARRSELRFDRPGQWVSDHCGLMAEFGE